jgi:DNA polymerase
MSIFELMGDDLDKQLMIEDLEIEASKCQLCPVHKTGMGACAFYRGNPYAPIFLLSEKSGPGEKEKGYPFASKYDPDKEREYGGTEGQVITCLARTGITETKMNKHWKNVFATNCCICALPQNRGPTALEISNCRWWKKSLGIVHPKLVITMGRLPMHQLLPKSIARMSMTEANGQVFEVDNMRVVCTYNPAYLIRLKGDSERAYDEAMEVWDTVIRDEVIRARKGWSP